MEVKPGYKQTEVGVIPEEWKVSTVGSEYEIKLGKMVDAEKNVGTRKPYLGNRAVQWDRIDISDLPTVPMSRSDLGSFRLQKGDLLVCEGGEVGRAAIWEAPIQECYYQKALHRLRPLRGFNSHLMAAFLRRWSDSGLLANYVTQTSIAHLPREKFMEVPMAVPLPSEQRAIATALSDVDGLLGGLDRLIAKKRDLKQAAMQQFLTGQTRLPGFHGEREVTKFEKVVRHHAGNSTLIKGRLPSSEAAGLFPAYSASGQDVWCHHFEHEGDAIVVSAVGSRCGKAFKASGRWCAIANTHVVWPNSAKIHAGFLAYFINDEDFWQKSGTGQPFVLFAKTFARPLRLPELPEQTAIAEVLTDMDAELAALEQRREKTRALKQAMMQELLTGRTRLM